MAVSYRVLRMDEGFWTDLPGSSEHKTLDIAKAAARSYAQSSKQRAKVVDSMHHCWLDTRFDDEESIARDEALKSIDQH